ncbi:MAG: DnaA regulatory inactivator Hda [Steroidobacteraceae bacterium]
MLQLPLGVRLREASRFDNFFAGPNAAAVHAAATLAQAGRATHLWLWGGRGSGRSHVLQAVCAEAGVLMHASTYLPLAELRPMGPGVFAGLEALRIVAIDDVDSIAGDAAWERALFNLYNGASEQGSALAFAAAAPPAAIRWTLNDLASRLSAAMVFQMRPLDDAELTQALTRRAALRGLELPGESADYLLRRFPRDMHTLCGVLDTLDEASLIAQRRLTVPFLKEVLGR